MSWRPSVRTTAPRLRAVTTSPSAASIRTASRTGVRERFSSAAIRCSMSRSPGRSRPSTIHERIEV